MGPVNPDANNPVASCPGRDEARDRASSFELRRSYQGRTVGEAVIIEEVPMSKKANPDDVACERERQNKGDLKGVRETAKRASEKAKRTSTYDPQRKNPPNWLKPPKS